MAIFLQELIGDWVNSTLPPIEIKALTLVSNKASSDTLFIAVPGHKSDGRLYVSDAIKHGAKVILVEKIKLERFPKLCEFISRTKSITIIPVAELNKKVSYLASRFYAAPSEKMNMVGITGTNGKSTCAHLLAQSLTSLGFPCGNIGTLGYGILGRDWYPQSLTTPDAIELQRILAQMVNEGARDCVMEATSIGLQQGRVNSVAFKSAIFTNLTQDHLDYHQSMEAYGSAKEILFKMPQLQRVIINCDDPFSRKLFKVLNPNLEVVGFSQLGPISRSVYPHLKQIYVQDVKLTPSGITAEVKSHWGEGQLRSKLVGGFNVSNLLAVLGELCLRGIPLKEALSVLAKASPVPGRMQRLGDSYSPQIIIDYSHTPDSLEKALIAARQHCKRRLWVVFGCGGDRDNKKRPLMGEIAARLADKVIITNDNPRTENPKKIVEEILQGIPQAWMDKVSVELERGKAIVQAMTRSLAVDVVLVAGKGHEDYQIIGTQKFNFSDEQCVRNYLNEVRRNATTN